MESSEAATVMIVEDDDDAASALGDVLREAGYRVTAARDGADALDKLGSSTDRLPDVLLVDLMMPRLDGWGFAARLRDDEGLARIPLVVMTAFGTCVLATAPVAAGYFTKPIAVAPLLDVLARAIVMRSMTDRGAVERRTGLGVGRRMGDDDDDAR